MTIGRSGPPLLRVFALGLVCSIAACAEPPITIDCRDRFETDRWTEDWSGNDVPRSKAMSLFGDGTILSLGVETHIRFEYKKPFGFGTTPDGPLAPLIGRALVHADLHAGKNFRSYVEVGVWDQAGKPNGLPFDEVNLALQRGFLDWTPNDELLLRVERQDVFDRSIRLLRPADAVNYQQVFDGVRIQHRNGAARTDVYIAEPFLPDDGYFQTASAQGEALWTGGSHRRTSAAIPGLSYGLYGIWIDRDTAAYLAIPGSEHRGVAIGRVSYREKRISGSVEYGRQFGQLGGDPISAWAFASDVSTALDTAGSWRVVLRLDGASGDQSSTSANESWAPTFPGIFYLGRNGVYNPANAIAAYSSVSWQVSPDIILSLTGEHVWRDSRGANFATPGGRPLVRAGQAGDDFLLNGATLAARWRISGTHDLRAAVFSLSPQGAFTEAGGETLTGVTLNLVSRF